MEGTLESALSRQRQSGEPVAKVTPIEEDGSGCGSGEADAQPSFAQTSPKTDRHGPWPTADQEMTTLVDPLERLRFKTSHVNLRWADGHPAAERLIEPKTVGVRESVVARRSYRTFAPETISLERLSNLLTVLTHVTIEGAPLPKLQYGSAGSLYPVQVYLYLKRGKVEGLRGGTYYYQPKAHELVPLAPNAELSAGAYSSSNRAIFARSSFAIFLVAQMTAITPMYGKWSRDFCMIEAGLITQLLETHAPSHKIGLCQVGGLEFQPIRHYFDLDEEHLYLHSLLGGPISENQTKIQALIDESEPVRRLIEML